jgi:Raf kinase inhibitor-like YbhB/YbcL family protein
MSFVLSSTAFSGGEPIPVAHSCRGADASPPLAWTEPPADTRSFALIVDDPDAPAGTWVHWVIFNIPPGTRGLRESAPAEATLFDGSLQGKNSSGGLGYQGPCPPAGTHRYFFRLYALDAVLGLGSGVSKAAVLQAMDGHVLGQAELMGTFSK